MRQGSVKILRDLCLIARLRRPLLQQYHWPGNVRELENIVERLLVYAAEAGQLQAAVMASMAPELFSVRQAPLPGESAKLDIADALAAANGSLGQAATLLGISRTTLWRRIKNGAADNGLRREGALASVCKPLWIRVAGQTARQYGCGLQGR